MTTVRQDKEDWPEADLLNKSSCLAPALVVTKFIIVKDIILITLCSATLVGLNVFNKPGSGLYLNKMSYGYGTVVYLWFIMQNFSLLEQDDAKQSPSPEQRGLPASLSRQANQQRNGGRNLSSGTSFKLVY
jgi:hypothetical protein